MYSLCLAILAAAPAPPQPAPIPAREIEADGFDSELGSVCVAKSDYTSWQNQSLTASVTHCKVSVVENAKCSPDKLALVWSECDLDGGSLEVKHPDGASVTVKLTKVPTCAEPLHLKGESLVHTDGGPFTGSLEFRDAQGQRISRNIQGGAVKQDRAALSTSTKRVIHSASTKTCEWVGTVEPPATGEFAGATDDSDPGEPPPLDQVRADPGTWCQLNAEGFVERRRRKRETLCAWTDGQGRFVEVYRPQHLLPGKRLNFVLLGPKKLTLRARQEGTIGYTAELDDQVATEGAARITGSQPALDAKSGRSQRWVFEGRGPGLAPVILEKEPGKEVHRIEIDYPKTYMGSVRVGFGLVWGNAVGPRYEAVQQPGSPTREIVEKEGSKVASELVLAYSVYPEAMLGGRNYREHLFSRNNWGLGPVVGLGVVSAANGKIDVLRSIYLGLEFEPVRFFSIGVGPVLRRVDALADGFHVGSALADANVPTKERLALGWFLMINVSPRFMKTAFPGK